MKSIFGVSVTSALCALVTASCSSGEPQDPTIRTTLSPVIDGAHLGERCNDGARRCQDGYCAKVLIKERATSVCTGSCAQDADCPLNWACQSIESAVSICVPPPSLLPSRTFKRAAQTTAPPVNHQTGAAIFDGGP